ncbi:granzyme A-like [Thalassophryne amazonica]|uniref:granzyme A-like n=1 Tax=Thalassophryne amazonica TaxID=390379 RepID=UPI0014717BB1|nr:granzyme A-like [Thalassophryne amazonica]
MLCSKTVGFFFGAVLLLMQSCDGAKIIGGKAVDPRSMPYMALVVLKTHICGGILIDPEWVLTAAHCTEVVKVLLGVRNITQKKWEQIINITDSVPHDSYNDSTKDNDLRLVKLKEPAKLTDLVKPLKLSETITDPPAGSTCLVAGWGLTNSRNNNISDVLMAVNVTVIDRMKCNSEKYYNYKHVITLNMICAGSDGDKEVDTCKGDSGGPLLCDNKLVGVTSFGDNPCGQIHKPGVYAFLSETKLTWINKTMKK